jgi:hypothetical protein
MRIEYYNSFLSYVSYRCATFCKLTLRDDPVRRQRETLRNVGIVYQPIFVVSNYYAGATAILLVMNPHWAASEGNGVGEKYDASSVLALLAR